MFCSIISIRTEERCSRSLCQAQCIHIETALIKLVSWQTEEMSAEVATQAFIQQPEYILLILAKRIPHVFANQN